MNGVQPPLPDIWAGVAEQGRICALAARGTRDLQDVAAAQPELFPAETFDAALLGSVAAAIAFTAPDYDAAQLRTTTRTLLWVFAADRQVDYLARSAEDVRSVVADSLTVADGGTPPPGRHLARLLAAIRDDLAAVPAFTGLASVWREELARMLAAVAREWHWKNGGGSLPTFQEYLDNADNLACSFVNVTHWIATADDACLRHLDELLVVGREVQRVLRLINDLATYGRDVRSGDLNALMLVPDPAEVRQRLSALTAQTERRLCQLARREPGQADYLRRQIAYTGGFYQVSDFWRVP